MIEGLVLRRPHFLRNGFIPFLGIREDGVDIEDHAPESKQAMADHMADAETRMGDRRRSDRQRIWVRTVEKFVSCHDANVSRFAEEASAALFDPSQRTLGKRDPFR